MHTIYASGQNREMWFLTEDGLYEVLMQSRKPIAKEFKKQVKQILKEIRKHGMYATDELLDNADFSKEFLKSEKETLISIKNYLPRKSFLLEIDFKTFFILSLPLR